MCGSWVQYRTDVRTCQEANRPEARGGATAPILRQAMEEVGMAHETLSRWHWLRVIAARGIPAPATIRPPRGCSWRGLEGRPTGGQELGSGSHSGRARQGLFPAGTEQDTSAVRRAGGHACPGLSSVRAAQMRWPMTAPMELGLTLLEGATLKDVQTASTRDGMRGLAMTGPLEGSSLRRLRSANASRLGWKDFCPETGVYPPEASR